MRENTVVLCDFDGTVSIGDVGEMLIEHFLGERWRELDEEYHAGCYGMVELYERSFSEIAADECAFERFVDSRAIDLGFVSFVSACDDAGVPIFIVSDGFDFYIRRLLAREGLTGLPISSNHLSFVDGRRLIDFPNQHETCKDCANCKKKVVDKLAASDNVVYVGNGLSDCCAAEGADLVYAKDALAEHFHRANLPFEEYNTFDDVFIDFQKKGILPAGG
ncbi:MAG: MtnX-like HAD-IB family phosphatase [Actinobacteria bacterium]|nr:MtnX-like HAD-IB family phosphatase [Actinomycetota bacterium]